MKLSLIIPAKDEADRLPPTLAAYGAFLAEHLPDQHEILVVINNSTDATESVTSEAAKTWPAIRPIVIEDAIGKGGAVREGFRIASGLQLAFVDADGATPPEAAWELVEHLQRHPEVQAAIASRWMKQSKILTPQPLRRRIASRLFNFAVRILFGLQYHDTQCGAKVFRAEALHPILVDLDQRGWLFDIEMLYLLKRAGHRVEECPTTWRDVAGSRFSMSGNVVPVLRNLLSLRVSIGRRT